MAAVPPSEWKLPALRVDVERAFPNARKLVRPGFDEQWQTAFRAVAAEQRRQKLGREPRSPAPRACRFADPADQRGSCFKLWRPGLRTRALFCLLDDFLAEPS